MKVKTVEYKVRLATPSDDVLPLMIEHAIAIGLTNYNVDKFRAVLDSFISSPDHSTKICLLLVGEDDIPYGHLFAIVTPNFLTDDTVANELGFFCKVGKGKMLIEAYESWAKNLGANKITLTSYGTERLNKYYENKGYNLVERTFIKDLS